jgi:hypothetical protein
VQRYNVNIMPSTTRPTFNLTYEAVRYLSINLPPYLHTYLRTYPSIQSMQVCRDFSDNIAEICHAVFSFIYNSIIPINNNFAEIGNRSLLYLWTAEKLISNRFPLMY